MSVNILRKRLGITQDAKIAKIKLQKIEPINKLIEKDEESHVYSVGGRIPKNYITVTELLTGFKDQAALENNPHVIDGRQVHVEVAEFLSQAVEFWNEEKDIFEQGGDEDLMNEKIEELSFELASLEAKLSDKARLIVHHVRALHVQKESYYDNRFSSFEYEKPFGVILVLDIFFEGQEHHQEFLVHLFGTIDGIFSGVYHHLIYGFRQISLLLEFKTSFEQNSTWMRQVLMYQSLIRASELATKNPIIDIAEFTAMDPYLINLEGAFNAERALPDFDFEAEISDRLNKLLLLSKESENAHTLVGIQKQIEEFRSHIKALEAKRDALLADENIEEFGVGEFDLGGLILNRYKMVTTNYDKNLVLERLPEAVKITERIATRFKLAE